MRWATTHPAKRALRVQRCDTSFGQTSTARRMLASTAAVSSWVRPAGKNRNSMTEASCTSLLTESYFEWWNNPPGETLSYLHEQVPDVRIYRAKARNW